MGKRVGYKRVSTTDQNTDRQLEGVKIDKLFEDKISGCTMNRPGLEACFDYLREGDTLVTHSIDRLARNLGDLEKIVNELNAEGVSVHFVKEGLTFGIGDENPMTRLQLQMMGAFAQFERALIRERQREGIAAAKAKGKHLGRKVSLTEAQIKEIKSRLAVGAAKSALAKEYGVSRPTLYSAIK